ncbi:MAG: T9SS type A sorting domain-containing protein, partial [Crocinitomicaceae bacterium]|nr:T9SS type A sorting domain-containing protein [Crocinitomicaceae bacterium]
DGDLDLLIGQYYGTLTYFENVGSASAPSFGAGVTLPFGLTATYQFAIPEFADLDADGDMDLLVGEYYGNLQYFENVGTSTAPNFAAPVQNPFGLTAGYEIVSPSFADFDLDGDLDMLLGEYYGNLSYYENTGTPTSPAFGAPQQNPFGLTPTYYFAFPALADLDNDGDVDVMVSEYYGVFQYFENDNPNATVLENTIVGSIDPNPFSDVLDFKFDQDVVHADFVNLAGQIVLSIENPKTNVDVSSLDPGVYIVKCIHLNDRQSEHKLQKL